VITAIHRVLALSLACLLAATASAAAGPAAAVPERGTPTSTAPADRVFADAGRERSGEAWVEVAGVDSDRNGVDDRVHVRWVRPAGDRERPVIVEPSPYFAGGNPVRNHDVDVELYVPRDRGDRGRDDRTAAASGYAYLYKRHGYAYVEAESLGSGGSTGCPTVGDADETAGAVAVVDWLTGRAQAFAARSGGDQVQAHWSDGHVGMIGVSYNGTLANAAASAGVEGLDAIVPISAISYWYGYYRDDGAVIAPGGYQGEDADVLAKYVLTRRSPEVCRPVVRDLRQQQDRVTGDLSGFWTARDYRPGAATTDTAVLVQHGLRDWNVKTSQFAGWYRALTEAGVPHRLWLHPAGHGDFPSYSGDRLWRRLLVRWFDRWLRGERNGVMSGPPVVWEPTSDRHVRLDEWPNPTSDRVSLHPRPGGRSRGALRLAHGETAGTERLVDDAAFTARELAARDVSRHRLLYATRRLDAGVTISGAPAMDLRVAFDAEAANVSAALVDIAPSGGVRRISEGWTDPQNRISAAVTTPIEPGTSYDLEVGLEPQQFRFAPGHRIGVVLLSSDHDYTLRPSPGTVLSVDLASTRLKLPVTGGRDTLAAALR